MIDIHCHILPNVDDGPRTIEQSLNMAKVAVEEGISVIIATPHHLNGSYENTKETILVAVQALNAELEKNNIKLQIVPGQETRIFGEYLEVYEKGEIVTSPNNGPYVLIELPSNHVPRYTSQLLYDIQMSGLTPIIVHPERNSELIETPDILYRLVKNGALTQITASSVTGHFGKNIKKFTEQLIDHNLTHFIASDAHDIVKRPFRLKEAYSVLEQKYGVKSLYYFQENANYLLHGEHVDIQPPTKIKKKKFLGLF